MSTDAEHVRLIRVFVSSPGDVAQEREVLDEVVASINRTDGHAGGFRLELFKWEDNVVPRIGPKPQEVVDAQTPAYDIYVGIMSARFGTPTGDYDSGTQQEFHNALDKWQQVGSPWITFYFNDGPPVSRKPAEVQQYLRVCEFREQLESKGIVCGYAGVRGSQDGFYEQIAEHLRKIVQLYVRAEPDQPASAALARATIPAQYLDLLKKWCTDIELLGLRDNQGTAVTLSHVYVPLTTAARQEQMRSAAQDDEAAAVAPRGEEDKPQLLLDRLAAQSVYVHGPPGCGKSTFCRWVARLACEGKMPDQPVAPPAGYVETFPGAFRARLPLLVRLRDFWTALPKTPGGRSHSRPELEAALGRWVDEKRPGELTPQCVVTHLLSGSLLLILDGVDEVPITVGDGRHAYQPREMLLSGLIASLDEWTGRGNRVLLTSRPYGISETDAARLGVPSVPIADLAAPLQQLLVYRWFVALSREPAEGRRTADAMLGDIRQRAELQPLASNPMLLTAMCVIYSQGKRLPQDKHDLYDRVLDNVLHNRYANDQKVIALVRNRLSVVAHGMHTGAGLSEDRATPQAEATYAEIDRMIQWYRDESPAKEPGFRGAVETREDLLNNSGLLLPQQGKTAGFFHFTFQDFLAAQVLLEREEDLAALFRRRAATSEWRSTLSFVYSSLMARHTMPDKGIHLIEQLIDVLTVDQSGLAVAAADCLEILAGHGLALQESRVEAFRRLCLEAIQQEVSLEERFELGLALGRLGDPRVVDDLRDHDNRQAWVEIPAGEYAVGDEKRPRRIERPLWISRYPITNSQYRLFIKDAGYAVDAPWWSEEGRKWLLKQKPEKPMYWDDAKWNQPNQPVVGVSFWEAEAFAAWAGGRLPGEYEWEAAARGLDGLKYPWGDDWQDGICNSSEAGLEVTTPVGTFPRSESAAFALADMAGNVWEWCSDFYAPTHKESYMREVRVLRGGSWVDVASLCRAAVRDGYHPRFRVSVVGFRVLYSRQDSM